MTVALLNASLRTELRNVMPEAMLMAELIPILESQEPPAA